jgi:biopolymer transport protein ExbD
MSTPISTPAKKPIFEDLVDMTAMVDIVFFLLIFFMVTSMQGVFSSIDMPASDPQKSASRGQRSADDFDKDKDFVVVRVDRDSTVWLEESEVRNEQELRVRLHGLRLSGTAPTKLLVLGSGEAKTGKIVMVLDAGNDAGMEELKLAIDEES